MRIGSLRRGHRLPCPTGLLSALPFDCEHQRVNRTRIGRDQPSVPDAGLDCPEFQNKVSSLLACRDQSRVINIDSNRMKVPSDS